MKTLKKITVALLMVLSFFAFHSATAATLVPASPKANSVMLNLRDLLADVLAPNSPSGLNGQAQNNAHLPLNNNIWFLVIASAAIGCKLIINKSKKLVAKHVKA